MDLAFFWKGFLIGLAGAVLAGLALAVAALPTVALSRAEVAVAIAGALVLAAIFAIVERLASHLPHIRQGEI